MATQQTTPQKRAYTITQFCDNWGISRATVYRLFQAGQLRQMKVGRRTLIPAESVETWAASAQRVAR